MFLRGGTGIPRGHRGAGTAPRARHFVQALLLVAATASASPAVFPSDANLVDVTAAPYAADPTGATDSTAAIQRALDDNANGNRMVFLPAGTYVVSDTLKWGAGAHGGLAQKRTILQGAGPDRTILRLADRSPGFQNTEWRDGQPAGAKAMIWTGQKPAQRFRNGIRDLTVDIGNGNPGATAIQYIANNQGSLRNVRIVAGENAGGQVGLDLGYTDEQGPCLIKDVVIEGFELGIRLRHVVNSVTFENIVLKGQRRMGLLNGGQCISVRRLQFEGACPAVVIDHVNAVVAIDQLVATGRGAAAETAAIVNTKSGYLYARDVKTRGFRQAIDSGPGKAESGELPSPAGHEVADFVSRDASRDRLFPSPDVHQRFKVPETPRPPTLAISDWASPAEFGGDPTGKEDSTEAIQRAIDSGKRGLYFPRGAWKIDGEVVVRGAVEVVTPHEGRLQGKGTLRFSDGTAPVVHFERADLLYTDLGLVWAAKRPLVVSGVTFGRGRLHLEGQGDVFLEDVCMGRLEIGQGQRVWARQLNIEWKGDQHPEAPEKIDNAGGQLWVLGYKTEMAGSVCRTRDGGRTVLFGGMVYAQGAPKQQPMLIVEDAALSATLGEVCWNFGKQGFHVLARETRGGETRELKGGSANGRYWHANGASAVPLFAAYAP